MKTLVSIPLIILLSTSCSVTKHKQTTRRDSLQHSQSSTSRTSHQLSQQQHSSIFQFHDSSGHRYLAEIIPDGPFSWSPQSGYSGKAKSVKIRGRHESSSSSKDSSGTRQEHQQSETENSSTQQLRQSSSEQVQKEKKEENNLGNQLIFWTMVLVLIMFGAALKHRKKIRAVLEEVSKGGRFNTPV